MKKVKRQFMIRVLVLALLALGLGGIHIYNERVQAAQDEENDTSTEIFKADPDTITTLDCDNNGVQTLSLERENDVWVDENHRDLTLDEAVVDDTLNTFASVSASRVLENVTASDYGFDAPLGEIRLIADGAETVFTIGMYNEMTGEYYVLINDDHSKVYVVDQTLYNITKKTASDFEAEVSEDGTEDSASENGGAKE